MGNKKVKKQKLFFSVVEEAILNEDFNKAHPNYAGGRIEIFHESYPYDIEEIRLMLPREMFEIIRDAIELKDIDYFQIGNVHSDDIYKRAKELIKGQNKYWKKRWKETKI